MFFIGPILLIFLGTLGAANLIIAKKPEAKELIAKIAPYQGYAGAFGALYGIWIIIHAVLNMGLIKIALVFWVTYLSMGVIMAALGLLLGVGMLKTWIKDKTAQAKMDELIEKLAPKQGLLGLIGLGLGTWGLVSAVLFLP